jgi:hypothetical protein
MHTFLLHVSLKACSMTKGGKMEDISLVALKPKKGEEGFNFLTYHMDFTLLRTLISFVDINSCFY